MPDFSAPPVEDGGRPRIAQVVLQEDAPLNLIPSYYMPIPTERGFFSLSLRLRYQGSGTRLYKGGERTDQMMAWQPESSPEMATTPSYICRLTASHTGFTSSRMVRPQHGRSSTIAQVAGWA